MIVLSLMLVLAGIALPTAKQLLSDQKGSRAARSIAAYFDQARSDAIAKGQYAGVRIQRLTRSERVEFGSAASIRLQRIAGVPPYAGEAADATVRIVTVDAFTGIANVAFERSDNLLLSLYGDPNAPIADGDLIELPGGKTFPLKFTGIVKIPAGTGPDFVTAQIDLNNPENGQVLAANPTTDTFPLGHQVAAGGSYPYRIHRKPKVSSGNPLSFSRGLAIDLNYSGIGLTGVQFAPTDLTAAPPNDFNNPIDILFGPDGRVEYVSTDNLGNVGPAVGMIYLCLGTTDGVVDPAAASATLAELFQNDDRVTTNIMDLDSIWIVINPSTGRVVTAPFASVSGTPTTTAEALTAIAAARRLASLSDTLDAAP